MKKWYWKSPNIIIQSAILLFVSCACSITVCFSPVGSMERRESLLCQALSMWEKRQILRKRNKVCSYNNSYNNNNNNTPLKSILAALLHILFSRRCNSASLIDLCYSYVAFFPRRVLNMNMYIMLKNYLTVALVLT